MIQINTDTWQKFLIGDFFDAFLSSDDIQPKNIKDGTIPLVSSGKLNNGIVAYIDAQDSKIWPQNTITVDMFGKAFYQSTPYCCVSHGRVNILIPKVKIAPSALQFIATIIESVSIKKYEFKEMCTGSKLLADSIKLPVDEIGNPDFAYMESYMRNLKSAVSSSLIALRSAKQWDISSKIDATHWVKFKINELFIKLDLRITKINFNKKLDVSEIKNEEFSLPLVNAKHFNNGIMYYGREADFETAEMTIDIVKNGAIATGDVFAQPQKTGVLWDAYLIKPRDEINSELVLLFLATVLRKTIKDKFSYDDKCIWEKVKLLEISLPVTEAGRPDYEYMLNYMQILKSKNLGAIEQLMLA